MSRTTRRGKPSRQFHKYIGLGVIRGEYDCVWLSICEGYRFYSGGTSEIWKNGNDDPTTYEEYTAEKIRQYHSDYRPWHKTPGYCHRIEVQRQTRLHKAALHHAIRNGSEDELILVRLQQDAEWMWS